MARFGEQQPHMLDQIIQGLSLGPVGFITRGLPYAMGTGMASDAANYKGRDPLRRAVSAPFQNVNPVRQPPPLTLPSEDPSFMGASYKAPPSAMDRLGQAGIEHQQRIEAEAKARNQAAMPFSIPYDATIPTPPQLGATPPMGMMAQPDYSSAREYFGNAEPVAPDQETMNKNQFFNILAGLSRGAAAVSPSAPGALSSTLAAMGAGGMGATARGQDWEYEQGREHQKDTSRYNLVGAEFESNLANTDANVRNKNTEIAYQNAQREYERATANQESMYKHKLLSQAQTTPKIEVDDDTGAVTVQRYNPETKSYEIQQLPGNPLRDLDAQVKALELFDKSGPAAELLGAQTIFRSLPPDIALPIVKKRMIEGLIRGGYGNQLLPPNDYAQITEGVKAELPNQALYTSAKGMEQYEQKYLNAVTARVEEWIRANEISDEELYRISGELGSPVGQMISGASKPKRY